MRNTKFYKIYYNIIQRCKDDKDRHWEYYGGRGIKCEWGSFEEFRDDMYESYLEYMKTHEYASIDRIDNNLNYYKENCRWATYKEQNNNRRKFKKTFYSLKNTTGEQ